MKRCVDWGRCASTSKTMPRYGVSCSICRDVGKRLASTFHPRLQSRKCVSLRNTRLLSQQAHRLSSRIPLVTSSARERRLRPLQRAALP